MFIVKQIINNETSIYEVKVINIARAGSKHWKQAFELADKMRISAPDRIELIPHPSKDEKTFRSIISGKCLVVEREASRHLCIAVIYADINHENLCRISTKNGICYQFLYRGDQLFVTNPYGTFIDSVK